MEEKSEAYFSPWQSRQSEQTDHPLTLLKNREGFSTKSEALLKFAEDDSRRNSVKSYNNASNNKYINMYEKNARAFIKNKNRPQICLQKKQEIKKNKSDLSAQASRDFNKSLESFFGSDRFDANSKKLLASKLSSIQPASRTLLKKLNRPVTSNRNAVKIYGQIGKRTKPVETPSINNEKLLMLFTNLQKMQKRPSTPVPGFVRFQSTKSLRKLHLKPNLKKYNIPVIQLRQSTEQDQILRL